MNDAMIWILVANSSAAKLYSAQNVNKDWSLLKQFQHPEGRERDLDLVSDKPGRYRNGMGPISALDDPTDPKQAEIDKFARQLAHELEEGRTHNAYQKLVIVAPPRFHGMLQKHCSHRTLEHIIKHLEKDYIEKAEPELLAMVRAHF